MIITLPWPDKRLSPNARIDRRARAGIVAAAREMGNLSTLMQLGRVVLPPGELSLYIKFEPPDGRRRDLDNLLASMKPALDGICKALEVDDSRVKRITVELDEPYIDGMVTVTVECEL